jgi:hypothetical protein
MSYAWILIVILNNSRGDDYRFQEFSSKSACLNAEAYIVKEAVETQTKPSHTKCVPKGGI